MIEPLQVYRGEIVKSKRKSKCGRCHQEITSRYKIRTGDSNHFYGIWKSGSTYIHLSCYKERIDKYLKDKLEETNEVKKKVKNSFKITNKPKYKRAMLIDKLKSEGLK